jgi:hypothetical protein
VRAAHERQVQQAGQPDIPDVLPLTPHQPLVFQRPARATDLTDNLRRPSFTGHGSSSSGRIGNDYNQAG